VDEDATGGVPVLRMASWSWGPVPISMGGNGTLTTEPGSAGVQSTRLSALAELDSHSSKGRILAVNNKRFRSLGSGLQASPRELPLQGTVGRPNHPRCHPRCDHLQAAQVSAQWNDLLQLHPDTALWT
jgi:hypothetical protein